ncbi:MAG TPA: hypothetical protein VEU62_05905, partial [Bryobacterales bacterium]|nr:hypothetical protein [Bryobacterales bacterium]
MRCRWLCVLAALLPGCAAYHPKPLEPPRLEKDYRARTLADPGLRAFVEANSATRPSEWPPRSLDLASLTLVGFYFSPDLDVARAQVRMAEAAITTAGARPNPSLSIGGGYSTSPES